MSIRIPFGKHRGEPLPHVADTDPDYLEWMLKNSDHDFVYDYREEIENELHEASRRRLQTVESPQLTEHQQDVVERLIGAMPQRGLFRLEGGAGVGKTFATVAVARHLIEEGHSVRACAVSYVATQVLAQQLEPIGVRCATIARTLKFTKAWRESEEEYLHSEDTPEAAREVLGKGRVLIVDECSMVSDRDANLLFQVVDEIGGILLLVGDPYQLPPVKQFTPSICCNPLPDERVARLTEPLRYSTDSSLYQVEQLLRSRPYEFPARGVALADQQLVKVGDRKELLAHYLGNFYADPDAMHRALFFTRRDVVSLNNAVRRAVYGDQADAIESDERLLILATADVSPVGPRLYSGQTFSVKSCQKSVFEIEIDERLYGVPCWTVNFTGIVKPVRIVFGDTEATTTPELTAALKAARSFAQTTKARERESYVSGRNRWHEYRTLQQAFVRVGYTYATTVHRCQGQTVDYAYMEPRQLLTARGLLGPALTYVAGTRARKCLTFR